MELFLRGLRDEATRMIVVKGVRRIGKSSLIRVGLRLHGSSLYAVFDARAVPVMSADNVYDVLAHGLRGLLRRARGLSSRLASLLERVEGVSVTGFEVRINRREPGVIAGIAEALGEAAGQAGEQVILVLDEAQEFSIVPGFSRLLAHIYDYHPGVKLVLAGSEVGLLDRLLGRRNPRAPLYGRPSLDIEMPRLGPEKAVMFLERGFEEAGVRWPRAYIEEAVARLDGIPGWLTAYGYYSLVYRDHARALRRTVEEGAGIVKAELERFLSNRGAARTRYLALLECLAAAPMTWSEAKRCLEAKAMRRFNNAQFTRYLRELRDYGFVEKRNGEYTLADPLIRYALRG